MTYLQILYFIHCLKIFSTFTYLIINWIRLNKVLRMCLDPPTPLLEGPIRYPITSYWYLLEAHGIIPWGHSLCKGNEERTRVAMLSCLLAYWYLLESHGIIPWGHSLCKGNERKDKCGHALMFTCLLVHIRCTWSNSMRSLCKRKWKK